MATAEITCPHCNRKQKVAEHRLAETVYCLVCQQLITDVYLYKVEPAKQELTIKLKGRLVSEFGTTKLEDLKSRSDEYTGKFQPVEDEEEDDTGRDDTTRLFESGLYAALPDSRRKFSTAAKTYIIGGSIMLVLAIGVTVLGVTLMHGDEGQVDTIDTAGVEGVRVERYPNGQKKSEWHVSKVNGESVPDGTWQEWFEAGERKLQGNYLRGKKVGSWIGWHANGQQSMAGTYKDGLEDGQWTEWHSNGRKAMEGKFKNGEKDGDWRTWYPSGKYESATHYELGKPVGQWVKWYDNGIRMSIGEYVNGKREGLWVNYHDNNIEELSENWSAGVLDGESYGLYRNRQKRFDGTWKAGRREGEWIWWHSNGNVSKRGGYLNGLEHGDWREWHPDNTLKSAGSFENGQRVGEWRVFDEDGNLAAERQYVEGRQESETWYFRGTVVKRYTRIHENGALKREWTVVQATDGSELMHGYEREYFSDGAVKGLGLYIHGLKEGAWRTWDEVGNLQTEVIYKNGEPVN